MDFGDILAQWDNQQKNQKQKQKQVSNVQVSHKKANAPTKEEKELMAAKKAMSLDEIARKENERHINPMELWLRRYGTVDKDALSEKEAERVKYQNRENIVNMRFEARLDLHGLKQEEAWSRLQSFVNECDAKHLKKILIVHGKGLHTHGTDPVLGEVVRRFIEQDKRLGTSGHPDACQGGRGATWVVLKKNLMN